MSKELTNEQKKEELLKIHRRLLELGLSSAAVDIAFSDVLEGLAPPNTTEEETHEHETV